MIGFDAEGPDLRITDDWFRCFNYRHGTKVILRGVAAQVDFPVVNGSSCTRLLSDCSPQGLFNLGLDLRWLVRGVKVFGHCLHTSELQSLRHLVCPLLL